MAHDDTLSEEGPKATLRQDGHIQRPLPQMKTVAERLAGTADPTRLAEFKKVDPGTVDDGNSWDRLQLFNKGILDRLSRVTESLVDCPDSVNPTKHPDFNTFVQSELTAANMMYVVTGHLPIELTKKAEAPEDADLGELDGVDPILAAHPAARAAIEGGLDIAGRYEEIKSED